jgi:hypothetical protein
MWAIGSRSWAPNISASAPAVALGEPQSPAHLPVSVDALKHQVGALGGFHGLDAVRPAALGKTLTARAGCTPLHQRPRSRSPTIAIATPKEKDEAPEKLVAQVEWLLHPVENVGGNARVEAAGSEQAFTSC